MSSFMYPSDKQNPYMPVEDDSSLTTVPLGNDKKHYRDDSYEPTLVGASAVRFNMQ